jgi:hypothetical protein
MRVKKTAVKDVWGRPYPGTFWSSCLGEPDLGHNRDYGHVCCRNCKSRYNEHGSPAGVATALGRPEMEKDRHLICNPDSSIPKKLPKRAKPKTEYQTAVDRLAFMATRMEEFNEPVDNFPISRESATALARDIRKVLHGAR